MCASAQFSMAAQVSLDDVEMTDVQTGQIVVKTEEGVGEEPAGPSGPPLLGLEYRDTRFIGAPAYPDVLAVSAHGQVAVALGSAVRVFDGATLAPIAVVKSADLVGESHDYARDVSGNALARSKQAPKRQRAADDEVAAPLCPLQLGTARFRSLAWSAPGAAPYQRCALCATVAHTTVVLDAEFVAGVEAAGTRAPGAAGAAGGGGAAPPRPGAAPLMRGPHAPRGRRRPSSFRCASRRARGRPRAPAAAASFVALGGTSALAVVRVAHHASGGAPPSPPRSRGRNPPAAAARPSPPSILRRRLARRRRHSRSSSAAPTARSTRAAPAVGRRRGAGGRRVAPHRRAVAATRAHADVVRAGGR